MNGGSVENGRNLNFSMEQGLIRPVDGEVLMHYSMDSSVYFATLDQYKYNPAVLFGAPEDTPVSACAQGLVLSVFSNEEIGNAVTLDLGNGYQATYGQLKDIQVSEGSLIGSRYTAGLCGSSYQILFSGRLQSLLRSYL